MQDSAWLQAHAPQDNSTLLSQQHRCGGRVLFIRLPSFWFANSRVRGTSFRNLLAAKIKTPNTEWVKPPGHCRGRLAPEWINPGAGDITKGVRTSPGISFPLSALLPSACPPSAPCSYMMTATIPGLKARPEPGRKMPHLFCVFLSWHRHLFQKPYCGLPFWGPWPEWLPFVYA